MCSITSRSKVVTCSSGQILTASEAKPSERKNDPILIQPSWPKQEQGRAARNMAESLQRQPANRALVSHCAHHHSVVFLLTFCSYSLLHACRKTFSNFKVNISSQWTSSCLNSMAPGLWLYEQ